MSGPIVVDPKVYYAAAKQLQTLATEFCGAVGKVLVSGLRATTGMAGNMPTVTGWASAYQQHSGDVRTVVIAYANALQHFADVLNVAGYNWDEAEFKADRNPKGPEPQRPTLSSTAALSDGNVAEIPNPIGDNGPGIVLAPAGLQANFVTGVPNGRLGLLAVAAAAWESFANCDEVRLAPVTLQAATNSFSGIQTPEVDDITEGLGSLQGLIEDIWTVSTELSTALKTYHDDLDGLRKKVVAAAPGAFPDAKVTTSTDDVSIHIDVDGDLGAVQLYNAGSIFDKTYSDDPLYDFLRKTDFVEPKIFSTLSKVKALAELPIPAESGNQTDNAVLKGEIDRIATWETPGQTLTAADLNALGDINPQVKTWIAASVKYGNAAGVDPRLVMAVVLNEGATRTLQGKGENYDDFRLLTSGFRDNSLGLTNMKEGPFNSLKKAYPAQFGNAKWSDLDGNEDLAIKATTYRLKQIQDQYAGRVSPQMRAEVTRNEFLAAVYNSGDSNAQNYLESSRLGNAVKPYVGRIDQNYVRLQHVMCDSGAYTCN
ncbi:hypothetical protein [Nocardia miyunensis]|uniref:hypothetical protein n=1 Tax=Nocardia miyunensis TaxID=282684 RepID=UPI00082AFA5C|nr:hypothetical protein [Nocardia miyunensis]